MINIMYVRLGTITLLLLYFGIGAPATLQERYRSRVDFLRRIRVSSNLENIYNAVLEGDAPGCKAGVNAALAEGIAPETILKEGSDQRHGRGGPAVRGQRVLRARDAGRGAGHAAGLAILKPQLAEGGATPMGKVIIGTVKGDLHDIGKNLVAMMLEGSGFEVIDLGTDVSPDKFVKARDRAQGGR